jgi:hypothetical protein
MFSGRIDRQGTKGIDELTQINAAVDFPVIFSVGPIGAARRS